MGGDFLISDMFNCCNRIDAQGSQTVFQLLISLHK
nr:MAG TPA: hypothetical protein [Bacteriophage sp.]